MKKKYYSWEECMSLREIKVIMTVQIFLLKNKSANNRISIFRKIFLQKLFW